MPISQIVTNSIANNVSVTFTAGSAAAPAVTTTGDTNTGMFFPAADTIAFAEGGVEAMRLDSSGNLLVGTTSPTYFWSGAETGLTLRSTGGNACGINIASANSNARLEVFAAFGNNNTGLLASGTSANPEILFSQNSGSTYNERMRIDSSGNLLVGTTSANGRLTVSSASSDAVVSTFANTSGSPYGLLTDFTSDPNNATNYGYRFRLTNNTNIYTIFSNGTTSARSDERFKKDIETTRDGYAEDLAKLRVVKYRWHNAEESSPKELGFIAQEVEAVFPNMISTEMNDDGIDVKSIKTSVFIPMLVKAIQELKAELDTVKTELAALKG